MRRVDVMPSFEVSRRALMLANWCSVIGISMYACLLTQENVQCLVDGLFSQDHSIRLISIR